MKTDHKSKHKVLSSVNVHSSGGRKKLCQMISHLTSLAKKKILILKRIIKKGKETKDWKDLQFYAGYPSKAPRQSLLHKDLGEVENQPCGYQGKKILGKGSCKGQVP